MCTVSFVRTGDKTIITSNRDEQVARPSIAPATYRIKDKNILFPKDPKAGGTWFAADEDANVAVLLNGAACRHTHNPPYRKSRGLILLDIISARSPVKVWKEIDLENIEPFTIVLSLQATLYQLRWDGVHKEKIALDTSKEHIWSSVTLYQEPVRLQRSEWFYDFIGRTNDITPDDLFSFHRYSHKGNNENGLVINRNDTLKTLSITQAIIEHNRVEMEHYDLIGDQKTIRSFIII
jgi:Transport and Golgi organisation 2